MDRSLGFTSLLPWAWAKQPTDVDVPARGLPAALAVNAARACMLLAVFVPLFFPLIRGLGWRGYGDDRIDDPAAIDDDVLSCNGIVDRQYISRGNANWDVFGDTYKFRMTVATACSFTVAVFACVGLRRLPKRSPFVIHSQCWLILNWLLATLWCATRGCKWCAGGSNADLQAWCGPLWNIRQAIWACCSIYLTFLVRMRSVALFKARGDNMENCKACNVDRILMFLCVQLSVLVLSITLSTVRLVWFPLNEWFGTATQSCLSAILLLTAAALASSIRHFRGPLRAAERVAWQSTGRRRQNALATARVVRWQLGVNIFGLLTSIVSMGCDFAAHVVAGYFKGHADWVFELVKTSTWGLDMVANALVVLFLSGIIKVSDRCLRPQQSDTMSKSSLGSDPGWDAKVDELASRGFSLGALLSFYAGLRHQYMAHYDPEVHTTADVVRQAIIPLTASDPTFGPCALATQLMGGKRTPAQRMVTHAWSNRFAHLVAAIVADALGHPTFEDFLPRLERESIPELLRELEQKDRLHINYWVCALSVNQHAGICGANPMRERDPVTNEEHPTCSCGHPKWFNHCPPLNMEGESINCEMNKFDDMMLLLAGQDLNFRQLIACDHDFDLFTRAWCVAEIHLAFENHVKTSIVMHSSESFSANRAAVENLRVQDMRASRQEDKDLIISKIGDPVAFNEAIKWIMVDEDKGLFKGWTDCMHHAERLGYISAPQRLRTMPTPHLVV